MNAPAQNIISSPSAPPSDFWEALAPHHASIENNYLDRASIRRVLDEIREPVLVVGAGQGLIVEELLKNGFRTDGVDLSSEMIRYAKKRRGLDFVKADARALPFPAGIYQTILYATGVVDFMGDEEQIRMIVNEARRVAAPSGRIFIAFCRMSPGMEDFLAQVGLLRDHRVFFRQILELYLLNPLQTLAWVAQRAKVGRFRAATMLIRSMTFSTMQEKVGSLSMQKIFRNLDHAQALINAAWDTHPYRNEAEIRNLFARLAIKIEKIEVCKSCSIVQTAKE